MNDVVIVFTRNLASRATSLPKEYRAQVKMLPPVVGTLENRAHPYGQWDALIRLLDPRASESMGVAIFSSKLPPSSFPTKGTRLEIYEGPHLIGTAEVIG